MKENKATQAQTSANESPILEQILEHVSNIDSALKSIMNGNALIHVK